MSKSLLIVRLLLVMFLMILSGQRLGLFAEDQIIPPLDAEAVE